MKAINNRFYVKFIQLEMGLLDTGQELIMPTIVLYTSFQWPITIA